MTGFLDSHESDVGTVFCSKTSFEEVFLRENGKTIVEQVKFNPLLIKTKLNGLIVKVRVHHIARLSTIGAETTCRSVRDRHRVLRRAIGVIVGGGRVGWERRDGCAKSSRCLCSSSGGRSTRVRAMTGSTSRVGTDARIGRTRLCRLSSNLRVRAKAGSWYASRVIN